MTWGTGMKLMEHSYYGVNMVRGVVELLKKEFNGFRFVWAGDYADETIGDRNIYDVGSDEDNPVMDFVSLLDTTTAKDYFGHDVHVLPDKYGEAKYLLNYDKKVAVKLSPNPREEYPIHPLPLLTAESNGCGGGDYYSKTGASLVGSWKYDHLGASDELPEGFTIEKVKFHED